MSTSSNSVTLNNGTVVTFRSEMTHEAEVARRNKMYEGVVMSPDGDGGFKTNGIPFANYVSATEDCLPLLIVKIESDGAEIPFSETWLKKLTERDFKLLKAQVDKLVSGASEEVAKGKKNS